ncbi:MAG: 30S ribosomal protein S18 [Acidimicrobiaceae bacterium]|nr:30S ribosomal protein S18 [Acidimicrobiaceae bacterium]
MDRRGKKKVSILTQEKIEYVDWKDVNLLRRFISDRAKIRARRVTGNSAQQQRDVAMAIKNAREMALLPYTNRVTTQRGGRGGDRRQRDDDRRQRDDDRRPRESRESEPQTKPAPAKTENENQDSIVETQENVNAEVIQPATTEETTE